MIGFVPRLVIRKNGEGCHRFLVPVEQAIEISVHALSKIIFGIALYFNMYEYSLIPAISCKGLDEFIHKSRVIGVVNREVFFKFLIKEF